MENLTPWRVIQDIKREYAGHSLTFTFSLYESGGQGVTKYRYIKRIDSDELNRQKLLTGLVQNEEAAINSRLYLDGKIRYIPMVDAVIESLDEIEGIIKVFKNYSDKPLYIFSSGRSYHIYTLKLITVRDWMKFNGELLLLNPPGTEKVIDSRWIGHSLVQGFGALRLTCNSHYYLETPELVKIIDDNASNE